MTSEPVKAASSDSVMRSYSQGHCCAEELTELHVSVVSKSKKLQQNALFQIYIVSVSCSFAHDATADMLLHKISHTLMIDKFPTQ